ncbi:tail protein [Serratia phage MQ-4]|nr:tail protein [Serratia phage MQ-4]
MFDLLPPNATPAERALSEAMGRVGDVPVIVKQVWNPDTCPADVLPWLAWAFSVDTWSPAWTEQQKRNSIKTAVASQRIKGTLGAVESQLEALGINIVVQEWFQQEPKGDPYTFKLIISTSQEPVTLEIMRNIIDIVNTNKNLRSHLSETSVTASSKSEVFTAAISGIGNEINVTNYVGIDTAMNDFNAVNNVLFIGE